MDVIKYRILNICMAICTILCLYGAFSVTGSGFLDLSNIGQMLLDTIAVISCVLFLVTYRKAWTND